MKSLIQYSQEYQRAEEASKLKKATANEEENETEKEGEETVGDGMTTEAFHKMDE